MELMVFDDMSNIALICLLLGLGVVLTIIVLGVYILSLGIMENIND